jgi:aryl-alcohol dehydrogenase-like predicted oxidoreductase
MEYSLLQRGIEREVVPAAVNLGIGILPWSPLGRGVLTGKYQGGTPSDSRGASQDYSRFVQPYLDDRASRIVGAVLTAADGLGVAPHTVSLSWVRDRPRVVAPIIGARTTAQLRGSLEADAMVLPEEIVAALNDVSMPEVGYPEAMPAGR